MAKKKATEATKPKLQSVYEVEVVIEYRKSFQVAAKDAEEAEEKVKKNWETLVPYTDEPAYPQVDSISCLADAVNS